MLRNYSSWSGIVSQQLCWLALSYKSSSHGLNGGSENSERMTGPGLGGLAGPYRILSHPNWWFFQPDFFFTFRNFDPKDTFTMLCPMAMLLMAWGLEKTTRCRHSPSLRKPPAGSQPRDPKRSVAIFLHNAVAIHRRIFCAKKEMVIYMEMVQILKEELSNKYRFHECYMKFHWFHALANWRWWEIWQLGERTRKLIASHQIQIVTLKDDKFRCPS